MTFALVLTLAWTMFWMVGLVPRTARRLVDRLSRSRWRAWHVLGAGVAWAWAGGMLAATSIDPPDHGVAVAWAGLPFVAIAIVLARRVEVSWYAGTHGSEVPRPADGVVPDVEGDAGLVHDAASYATATARLRAAAARPHRRTRFQPRLVTPDVDVRDVRRHTATARASVVVAVAWMVPMAIVVVTRTLTLESVRGAVILVVGVGAGLAAAVTATGAWLLNRRHARLARTVNGARVTWPVVAAVHGWRLTRPGLVPHPHWRLLSVFHDLVSSRTATTVLPPLVTLSGQVNEWETWIVVGERGDPMVVAVHLPGLSLPRLVVERAPGDELDLGLTHCDDAGFAHVVLHQDLWAHLGATMPAFARIVLEGDVLAMATVQGIAPRPWRSDAMVACLLGVADRLPLAALLELTDAPPATSAR